LPIGPIKGGASGPIRARPVGARWSDQPTSDVSRETGGAPGGNAQPGEHSRAFKGGEPTQELKSRTDDSRTRAAIQREALRLFMEKGFEATTPEEIAMAVDISQRDLVDFYPSKAAIVLQDDIEPMVIAAFGEQPPELNPIAAMRNAIRTAFSTLTPEQVVMLRQRALLIQRDPAIRAAMLAQFGVLVDQVAEVAETRAGESASELAVRDQAGALIRVILSAVLSATDAPQADLVQQMDTSLAKLEVGLPLATVDQDRVPPATHLLTLRDGRRLAYTEWGSRDGAPIIHLHGTPGSRFEHEAAEELYRSLGVRMITPDRPGYGLSDPQPHRRLVDWPADLVELADSLHLQRFGMISLSGGGIYALACAALIPERITCVVTTGCPAPLDRPGALTGMEFTNEAGLWLEEKTPRLLEGGMQLLGSLVKRYPTYFVDRLRRGSPPPDQQVLSTSWVRLTTIATLRESLRTGPCGYNEDLRILTRPWGFAPENIRLPVHLWHGEIDAVIPLHHARYLASVIPGATLTICPGEAHMLLWNHLPEILTTAAMGSRQ
jgi:pimeloyl-ACP methyl ester carboxylesterase/AcrR family transcriptional regulator